MIRKISALIVCAMLLVFAAVAEPAAEYTAPEAGAPMTLEGDMGLLVNDVWYPILNDFAPLKEALGEPDDTIAAPSCVFKGDDKEFVYGGTSIFTNPLGDLDVWYEAYITSGDMVTARGVGIGTAEEDMFAAYGDGYYSEGEGMYTYSISGDSEDFGSPCIIFTVTDGIVSCIDIYYPTNTL